MSIAPVFGSTVQPLIASKVNPGKRGKTNGGGGNGAGVLGWTAPGSGGGSTLGVGSVLEGQQVGDSAPFSVHGVLPAKSGVLGQPVPASAAAAAAFGTASSSFAAPVLSTSMFGSQAPSPIFTAPTSAMAALPIGSFGGAPSFSGAGASFSVPAFGSTHQSSSGILQQQQHSSSLSGSNAFRAPPAVSAPKRATSSVMGSSTGFDAQRPQLPSTVNSRASSVMGSVSNTNSVPFVAPSPLPPQHQQQRKQTPPLGRKGISVGQGQPPTHVKHAESVVLKDSSRTAVPPQQQQQQQQLKQPSLVAHGSTFGFPAESSFSNKSASASGVVSTSALTPQQQQPSLGFHSSSPFSQKPPSPILKSAASASVFGAGAMVEGSFASSTPVLLPSIMKAQTPVAAAAEQRSNDSAFGRPLLHPPPSPFATSFARTDNAEDPRKGGHSASSSVVAGSKSTPAAGGKNPLDTPAMATASAASMSPPPLSVSRLVVPQSSNSSGATVSVSAVSASASAFVPPSSRSMSHQNQSQNHTQQRQQQEGNSRRRGRTPPSADAAPSTQETSSRRLRQERQRPPQQQQQHPPPRPSFTTNTTANAKVNQLPLASLPENEKQWSLATRLCKSFLLTLATPASVSNDSKGHSSLNNSNSGAAGGNRETQAAQTLEQAFFGVVGREGVDGNFATTAAEMLAVWERQVRPMLGKPSDSARPLQGELWVALFALGTYLNTIVSTITLPPTPSHASAPAGLAVYKAGLRAHTTEALTDACHYANELSELLKLAFQSGGEAEAPPYSILPIVLRRVRTVFEAATIRGVAMVQSNLNTITSKLFAVLSRRVRSSAVQPLNAPGQPPKWMLTYDSKEKESLLHSFAYLVMEMIVVDAPMHDDVQLFVDAFHACFASAGAERCVLYYRCACALLRQPLCTRQLEEAAELLARALAVCPEDAPPQNRRVMEVKLLTAELALGRLPSDEYRISLDVPQLIDAVNALKAARLDLLDTALRLQGPFFVEIGVHNVLTFARQRIALLMVVKYYQTHECASRLSVRAMVNYFKLSYTQAQASMSWLLPLLVEKKMNGVLDHDFLILSGAAPFDDYPLAALGNESVTRIG